MFYHMWYTIELKQIPEISGYPFEIHYPDTDLESFWIVANYFKQLLHVKETFMVTNSV